MLRVASLAFILQAGVKFTWEGGQPPTRFRTEQASIDTMVMVVVIVIVMLVMMTVNVTVIISRGDGE